MDEHDITLLGILQESGRTSLSNLSVRVGLSIPAVTERIKKLETMGTVKGYTTLLDAKKLGIGLTAFISVEINDPMTYISFAEAISRLKEIQECHHVVGEFDYILKVKTRDTDSLESLISKNIRTINGVGRTRTTVVLSSPIESTHIDLGSITVVSGKGGKS